MSNIVASIIDYVANIWHNTDQDYVMAEHINGWENQLQNMSQFLSRYAWHPNTAYPKGSVILYPFGLNTKLVSQNTGTSGSKEPTWSDAQGEVGSRTVTDNDIIWKEAPMEISSDVTPIGTIKQQLWHTAPPGYIKLDVSQVLNRVDYPELWEFVQNYAPLISEVDWQKQAAKQNTVAFFSSGDGSTTFRTPVIVDFARGGSVGSVGVYTADQNKKHNHNGQISGSISTITAVNSYLRYGGMNTNITLPQEGWSSYICTGDHADGGEDTNIRFQTSIKNFTITNTEEGGGGEQAMPRNVIMPFFLRALNI